MCTDTKESLRIFLTQQLRDVEADIETISSYISYNPPETSGELPETARVAAQVS